MAELIILGHPLIIYVVCSIAAYYRAKRYKSAYKHPVAKFFDTLVHALVSIAAGVALHEAMTTYLGFTPDAHTLIAVFTTLVFDPIANHVMKVFASNEWFKALIEFISNRMK